MQEEQLTFADGLKYSRNDWKYCTSGDRRFYQETLNGFAAGRTVLTQGPRSYATTPARSRQ